MNVKLCVSKVFQYMQILPRDIKQGKNDYLVTGQSNRDNKLFLIIFPHDSTHERHDLEKKTNEGACTPGEDSD